MQKLRKFSMDDDDLYAISIAMNAVRMFLCDTRIKAKQVMGLGNALYALERLPLQTEGVDCEFGITYRHGTEDDEVSRYISFIITPEVFKITDGGSVYDKQVGSDSYSNPGWIIEIDGYKETGCQLFEIENSIREYLKLGAEIVVTDNSEIDYYEID